MAGTLRVVLVALGMFVNPLPVLACHRTAMGKVPVAAAVNVAVPPLHAVTSDGWSVMVEENGIIGVTKHIMTPVSNGTTTVSHFRNHERDSACVAQNASGSVSESR